MLLATQTCRVLLCGIVMLTALGCSGSSMSPSGTPGPGSPTPVPSDGVADVAGTWVGTFESANFGTQTISMVVVQFANCVDGSWRSSTNEWSGAISGFAGKDSFAGQMSLERPGSVSAGGCLAVGNISGDVGSGTLKWTSAQVTPSGTCAGDLPQSIVVTMRRQ